MRRVLENWTHWHQIIHSFIHSFILWYILVLKGHSFILWYILVLKGLYEIFQGTIQLKRYKPDLQRYSSNLFLNNNFFLLKVVSSLFCLFLHSFFFQYVKLLLGLCHSGMLEIKNIFNMIILHLTIYIF